MALLEKTERGLYCVTGDFYIDPWRPVDFAVVTHAHSDHARFGSKNYLGATPGREILQTRLGPEAKIETLDYGKSITRNGVRISLHPAGHILGSAQVRVELRGEIWVVSGDYKTEREKTCAPFEPVRCHLFVTECTFGLPIYRWRPQAEIFSEVNSWWRANQGENRTSVLFAYSLGKSQRLLSGIDPGIGPIFVHGSVANLLPHYASAGIDLPKTIRPDAETIRAAGGKGLVIAPASTDSSPWLRKFGATSKAFASGWMQLRGARRRRALDRGFVLSDHADWNGLLETIRATGAERIWATHGYTTTLVRWLRDNGYEAEALVTQFDGEIAEEKAGESAADSLSARAGTEETSATIE
jgi:putative mRNA 3-end processing factor